jgi:hypothetical protein
MKLFSLTSLAILATASMAVAQSGGEATRAAMLQSLERPGDFESRRSSSADPNWQNGNGDCRPIKPGETLTLAELDGPGRITHIWFTISAEDKFYPRSMTLRIYWDGREEPSVESPIGDFFAVGHGLDVPVDSFPVAVSSDGRARNCYWPMPFGKSAKITVSNDSPDKNVGCIFWYIDWQKLPSLPADTMYFHAQYRQEFPCKSGEDYLIFDGEGDGLYVGTVESVHMVEPGWFGEGDDRFYIDGAAEPQLRGTGTEDYFCDAWGFRKFTLPFYGVTVWEGFDTDDRGTAYRWHVPDPVRFHKSLKVTIEHKGSRHRPSGEAYSGFEERPDYYSSVAFWYQGGEAKRFATVPPGPERLLPGVLIEAESLIDAAKTSSEKKPESQPHGPYSGGKQLFWMNPDATGWIEVPFEAQEDGRYVVKLDLTRSFDYGTFEIALDGKKLGGARNLYSPAVIVQTEKLGLHELKKGTHTLRFTCVGTDPKSKLGGGKPGYFFGLDAIELRRMDAKR